MSSASATKGTNFVATRNACKLCAPLGACIAFRGIEGTLPFLHGSQGCATYIRRYVISHFKEPMDIAASNFSEASTIFGGGENLSTGLRNVTAQYRPHLIGIATTCLPETIGDDVPLLLSEYLKTLPEGMHQQLAHASTPSYRGTHIDGFHAAVRATVEALAEEPCERRNHINLFPGFVSPADLRHLKEIVADFGLKATVLPDYSETMDGPAVDRYQKIPPGGTPLSAVRASSAARASVEFGSTLGTNTAAAYLSERFNVPLVRLGTPIGICQTDAFFGELAQLSRVPIPHQHQLERGRLIDAYVDAHKYVFGRRAVIFGEEDLVVGLAAFLAEIGVVPALVGSGGESGRLAPAVHAVAPDYAGRVLIREGADFMSLAEEARGIKPDLLIGSSKGYALARELNVPLVRVGFPIHDRTGGQRILHLGYRGTQQLFDRIVNAIIESDQQASPVGYSYM